MSITIIDTNGCRRCGVPLKQVTRNGNDDTDSDVAMQCMNPKCSLKGWARFNYRISKTARILPPPVND